MFVLSNAWRALTRSKGRTALAAFITLAVTFGTVAGLAIIQEDTNAHTTAYDQQKATLAIRPTAATWKKVSATDQSSTRHYMTWSTYNEYAALIQSAVSSLNFTFTETAPARVNGDLKHLLGSMALLPQSVPGLIIATSWLLLAPWIGLYNSPWLILAAYVTAFLGLVVQTVDAPIRAMPQFLIDAARISGASPIAVLRDITWRMGTPAATTGAAMVFITAVRELTISALLLAPDTQTLGVVVFSLQQSGSYNAAAALSLIITVIGLLVLRLTTTTMRGR